MALNCRYVRIRTTTAWGGSAYDGGTSMIAEVDLLDAGSSPISRSGWSAAADTEDSPNVAANVLDADSASMWVASTGGQPHLLTLDLGSAQAFSYVRIQNKASGSFGSVGGYEIEYSLDNSTWFAADSGTWNTGTPSAGTYFASNELFPVGPTVSDAGDEVFATGETAIPITGSGFGASQGSGTVYLSPTDDVDDVSRVEQTVTSWSDTAIAFTCVKGGLSAETNLYLFVVNDSAESNAAGYVVQIQAQPTVTETLIGETGATVNSETGMTMVVWHTVPTTASPNPAQVIEGVSSDGSGQISVPINRGALALDAPVWIALMKDGSPAKGTLRKVSPVYA